MGRGPSGTGVQDPDSILAGSRPYGMRDAAGTGIQDPAEAAKNPDLSDAEKSSYLQGGGGVALRSTTFLSSFNSPIPIGKTPGPGTQCDIYLQTNMDPAYAGAVLGFYAEIGGILVLYNTITLSAQEVAADTNVAKTTGGFGAEFWEVRITLAGPTLPVASLQSAVIAYGVEDDQGGNSSSVPGAIQNSQTFNGPGGVGTYGFNVPGLNKSGTYLVTVQARITSSLVDAIGSTFSTSAVFTWKNVANIVTLVPVVLSAPDTNNDAIFTTMTTGVGAAAGQATVTFTLPAGLNASTQTQVTVSLLPSVVK